MPCAPVEITVRRDAGCPDVVGTACEKQRDSQRRGRTVTLAPAASVVPKTFRPVTAVIAVGSPLAVQVAVPDRTSALTPGIRSEDGQDHASTRDVPRSCVVEDAADAVSAPLAATATVVPKAALMSARLSVWFGGAETLAGTALVMTTAVPATLALSAIASGVPVACAADGPLH